jgi:phosphatidylglycerophosphate synthase
LTAGTENPAAPAAQRTAVLMATAPAREGGSAAALDWDGTSLLSRLVTQLATLEVRQVHVITRPEFEGAVRSSLDPDDRLTRVHAEPDVAADLVRLAAVARMAPGGLVVALADIVTQRQALAGLLVDPRLASAILVTGSDEGDPYAWPTRSRRGRVVSAASGFHSAHDANHRFLGVIKVAPDAVGAAADAAERMAAVADDAPGEWDEELRAKPAGWQPALHELGRTADQDELDHHVRVAREDATALLLVSLVRAGEQLGNSFVRHLFWARPDSQEAVRTAQVDIQGYDEDRALLDSAVKGSDGFFTTFFVSPYSKYIARWAARRGLTPNFVTSVSLFIGILAAAAFATGKRDGLIAGAVLLQMAFTTDCVDGQLARYTRTFSKLGAWLDSIFDRAKEYLVFAGLAIGASRSGDPAWLLAGAALTLQTARHSMEFSWSATMHQQIGATKQPPLEQVADAAGASVAARKAAARLGAGAAAPVATTEATQSGALRSAVQAWSGLDDHPVVGWLKRIAAFPIGERFATISLVAAFTTPHTVFVVMLACGGFATLYSVSGRVLRSIAR